MYVHGAIVGHSGVLHTYHVNCPMVEQFILVKHPTIKDQIPYYGHRGFDIRFTLFKLAN